eukprot:m.61960 g.61960  ORF g.61960 m.61960 type:complete len:309 (-) comp8054_c0_seq2:70-996(-)
MLSEVGMLKDELDQTLGPQRDDYWKYFRLAIEGKISKAEWDARANECLGPLNIHVHNDFVTAILRTADATTVTPRAATAEAVAGPAASKHVERLAQLAEQAKRRDIQRASRTGWQVPFDRGVSLPNRAGSSLRTDRRQLLAHTALPGVLPGLAQIRSRAYVTVIESDLQDITASACELIQAALDHHIKGVVEECIALSGTSYRRSGHFRHDFSSLPLSLSSSPPATHGPSAGAAPTAHSTASAAARGKSDAKRKRNANDTDDPPQGAPLGTKRPKVGLTQLEIASALRPQLLGAFPEVTKTLIAMRRS